MTIFVAHAPADQKVAEDLEKFLERRGHFSELDDGMTAMAPVTFADVVVLLVSKDFVVGPMRLRLEQRALDAWAEGRLIVVKLDTSLSPVGLRDLPALDASSVAQREFKWNELADQLREKVRAPRREPAGEAGPSSATQSPAPAHKSAFGFWGWLIAVLAMAPGIAALALTVSIWLVNRIGPRPGTLEDLLTGVNGFGVRYGLPAGAGAPICAGAILLMFVSFALLVGRIVTPIVRKAKRQAGAGKAPAPGRPSPEAPDQSQAVFVSYARANSKFVLPVIEAAKQDGRSFWLDQHSITPAEGWAGEIVRAIRGAREVLVMCSKAAFESDQVKREIYLADRYHKKLVPVFIEDAAAPEDFEYFFAGVQVLKLFETPEAERAAVLTRALG